MDFEDLLPFIIFIGYFGFAILRGVLKRKKSSQDGTPSQKRAPKKAFGLSKIVDKIKAELELAGLEMKKQKEKDKALARDAEAEFVEAEFANTGFEDGDLEEILKEETGSSVQASEIQEELPIAPKVVDMPCDIKQRKKRKQRRVPILSVSKMREAIILSEIIAKPVGLRDEPF